MSPDPGCALAKSDVVLEPQFPHLTVSLLECGEFSL